MKSMVVWSRESDEWETPAELFNKLNTEFKFTLDPCATRKNAKCKKFYTKKDDGLSKSWKGHTVFINPPYSDIRSWVAKAANERECTCVLLVPARTDTRWFHDHVYSHIDWRVRSGVHVRFLKGRIKFEQKGKPLNSAPFPSMIITFRDSDEFSSL